MTPHQITLVRDSFGLVQPIANQAAALFYANLFDADPSLRTMFRGNMTQQGERLMSMIGAAVAGLSNLEKLAPVVRQLGARHAGYGVRDEHYETVGAALLKTLQQGLGESFTREVHDAWAALYGIVSRTMMEAAREPAAA